MEWGSYAEFLEKRAAKGKRTAAIESKPDLHADLYIVWRAFGELHRSRQTGFGPSPLSVQDITAWLDLHDIDDKAEFFELIQAMDETWLTWAIEQSKGKHGNGSIAKTGN